MAVGRPGVPSWAETAGDQHRQAGSGSAAGSGGPAGEDPWAAAGPVGRSSRLQALLSRSLAYGLWGLVAGALVLGLVNCAGLPTAGDADPAGGETPATVVAPPSGCAELLVAGWLAGDSELLEGVPGVPRGDPEPGRRQAASTYTASVTEGEGAWSYLVGAEVQVRAADDGNGNGNGNGDGNGDPAGSTQGPWQAAGLHFFRVTMVPAAGPEDACQGWRPAALPAQVPGPALAGDPSVPYDQPYPAALAASGTELSETLEAFFAGMLTGGEELERYVAPGVFIPALVPPPYQEVSVTELRARQEPVEPVPPDGTVVQLLVTVATDADDLPLVYPVTVGVRGGRWEVVALDPLVGTAAVTPAPVPGATDDSGSGPRTNGG